MHWRLRNLLQLASRILKLLEELTARARDINPARDAALAVFHALDDARGLAALGAIRALGGVHDLLAVFAILALTAMSFDLLISNCAQRIRA